MSEDGKKSDNMPRLVALWHHFPSEINYWNLCKTSPKKTSKTHEACFRNQVSSSKGHENLCRQMRVSKEKEEAQRDITFDYRWSFFDIDMCYLMITEMYLKAKYETCDQTNWLVTWLSAHDSDIKLPKFTFRSLIKQLCRLKKTFSRSVLIFAKATYQSSLITRVCGAAKNWAINRG